MGSVKVVLNRDAVRDQLLKSPEMRGILRELAQGTADRLGEGYAADDYQAQTRVVSRVTAETRQARKENMENNTILKALRP